MIDCSSCTEPCSLAYLTWIHSLALTKQEEKELVSGGWLSASHISAVHKLLRKAFPNQEGLNDTSVLAERLSWPSKPENFVQIIHVSDCHWACLSNQFCAPGSVDLYDTFCTIPVKNGGISKQACAILRSEKSSVTINVINVQYQVGSCDCGLFAVAMAYDLCSGIDPHLRNYDQSRMREHLRLCFEQCELESFPEASSWSPRGQERVFAQVVHEIFCNCRLPEKPPMACCDVCGTWYHQGCTHIPSEVFEDEGVFWMCDKCKLYGRICVNSLAMYTCTLCACIRYIVHVYMYFKMVPVCAIPFPFIFHSIPIPSPSNECTLFPYSQHLFSV